MSTEAESRWSAVDEPEMTAAQFKGIFRRHPAGVAVVTFLHDDQPVGFTATSVISVSADPPVAVFSIAGTSSSWPKIETASHVVINFLGADQAEVSARFATSGIDRFAQVPWSRLDTGEPVLHGATAWLRGEVDHHGPVGESHLVAVRATDSWSSDQPGAGALVYHDRVYHRLDGAEPRS